MPLTDDELDQIRRIVRQELRREREGIRCPECGEKQLPAAEWDRYSPAPGEVWGCHCGFEAPPGDYENAY